MRVLTRTNYRRPTRHCCSKRRQNKTFVDKSDFRVRFVGNAYVEDGRIVRNSFCWSTDAIRIQQQRAIRRENRFPVKCNWNEFAFDRETNSYRPHNVPDVTWDIKSTRRVFYGTYVLPTIPVTFCNKLIQKELIFYSKFNNTHDNRVWERFPYSFAFTIEYDTSKRGERQ